MHAFVIDKWEEDPEFPVHPIGSQPKRVVIAPPEAAKYGLKPGHTYIYKGAKVSWQGAQLWSEVIAYRIADLIGVKAPRCFPAILEARQEAGVLMESFLGEGDDLSLRYRHFVHGADFLNRVISDKKRGRPHLLTLDMWISRIVCSEKHLVDDWWVKTIFFDSLIGNSDRHPQNWGIIFGFSGNEFSSLGSPPPVKADKIFMGPAFDNGTSLGYEAQEEDLPRKSTITALEHYIERGRHHCSWDDSSAERGEKHIALCQKLIEADINRSDVLRRMMSFKTSKVDEILAECVACDFPLQPFSHARAYYVSKLLEMRRTALLGLVE